jgi:hypothetical protein
MNCLESDGPSSLRRRWLERLVFERSVENVKPEPERASTESW